MSESLADPHSWFDEISFDPNAPLLQMGTRRVGEAGWLVPDDKREVELALKSQLFAERHGDVFAAHPAARSSAVAPAARVLEMVRRELGRLGISSSLSGAPTDLSVEGPHPLEQAGRLVQEDLCLIHFRDGTWHLDAASLCFPSRWRLADKIGRPLAAVHSPVNGYDPILVDRVNKAFDHLLARADDRPVWRRNWFIHPDSALFQPCAPAGGDPLVPADRALANLWVRSERQVLRRVDQPDWAVFSIRVQQASVAELCIDPGRRTRLFEYFSEAADAGVRHHGVSAAQRTQLLAALQT